LTTLIKLIRVNIKPETSAEPINRLRSIPMTTRRQFFRSSIPAVLLLSSARLALAEPAKLEESDATATALGYKHDATKVDSKKSPTYMAGRACGNCQLYQGKPGDAWGVCAVMGGKLVNAKGWCSAWAKKA
jgi:hypothetical protein